SSCTGAVCQAMAPRNPVPCVLVQLITAYFNRNPERLYLLPLEHGPAAAIAVEGHEQAAIVGRVQLSTECDIPPARRLQRRKSRADLLENPQIRDVTNLRDREVVVSGQPRDEPSREPECLVASWAELIEILRVAQ